jgi:hypothetical protein
VKPRAAVAAITVLAGAGHRWRKIEQGAAVSATVLYMSMSLDGFIAGPNEGPGNGLGDGGHRLHEWFMADADADHKGASGRSAGVNGKVIDEFMSTGAVVAGRGTFEPAGGWGGDHHDGVPIFVLSRTCCCSDRADLAVSEQRLEGTVGVCSTAARSFRSPPRPVASLRTST